MINAKRDCINALVILTFAAILFFAISTIPDDGTRRTGPAFFPSIVVPVLGVLGLTMLIVSIVRMVTERQEALVLDPKVLYRENRTVVLIFLACAVYIPALYYLGYLVATPFFVLGVFLLLRGWHTTGLWAVTLGYLIFTVLIYIVFERFLNVILPSGQLF